MTATEAVDFLAKYGTKVSEEEAEIILDFMFKMSKLTVENFTKSNVKPGALPLK